MRKKLSKATRKFLASRANFRCEYCRKPEIIANTSFHIEHIISLQHKGTDNLENLAYSCSWCNWKKGTNIATVLHEQGKLIPLFHPRKDKWEKHFEVNEGLLIGKTNKGKGTIQLLEFNKIELILERKILIEIGLFP